MKSLHMGSIAGDSKLRGKKTVKMSCGCCDMVNFTDSEREKAEKKEISNFVPELEVVINEGLEE